MQCHDSLVKQINNVLCFFSKLNPIIKLRLLVSYCYHSTVVRNTVVRATIKGNGKPQILGTCSFQTPESINLKFDLDDYIGGLTLRAKNGTNQPSRVGGVKE